MKVPKFLLLAAVAALGFTACGNNNRSGNQETNDTTSTMIDSGGLTPDTAPAAQLPPGAPNPGEDSARYGTGTGDTSKNNR
ncbi:hypothetical protein SAMN05444266_10954 [Chitinophaga jiangningensis]|uniref:Lipoprotein n=1 Tax=Chitinophaga jiangningensis TaxID=1419482 RepID=A0A1M7JX42_9BACT|nr:hypothetical protein [Chitinophaga jiangningensis]SHM57491.1 hypothetical protein SAMN05444266_10954 [Chitinophaga jiangningensis]